MSGNDDLLLDLGESLADHPVCLVDHLDRWADSAGARSFLQERRADGTWDSLSYGEARAWVDAVAQDFVNLGVTPGTHVVILDRNSLTHAVVSLAAMRLGAIATPVSCAYPETEFGRKRLAQILRMLSARMVLYVGRDARGAPVSASCTGIEHPITETQVLARRGAPALSGWAGSIPRQASDEATISKLMFTSGSTGQPKAVPHTHRMLCAQQQQMAQAWPFLEAHPPVLCDWLPWHHTSGGNNSFNMTLRNGGTLYIDDGSPTPSGMGRTRRNLIDARPTWYTNVPLGYTLLAKALHDDPVLASAFLSRLDILVYGGAPLAADTWNAMSRLHVATMGQPAPWGSGWGLTETTSTSSVTRQPSLAAGHIGLPLPGLSMRLRPSGMHFRALVKGPNVFPGYWDSETGAIRGDALEDGYFDTGDLLDLVDRARPELGLRYVGRASEVFKINSGVWVIPSLVRGGLLEHLGPCCKEVIPFSDAHGKLVAAVWLHDVGGDPAAAARTLDLGALEAGLARHNEHRSHTSERVHALVILDRPPSAASGELTDKGSIHRAQLLTNRRLSDFDAQALPAHATAIRETDLAKAVPHDQTIS